MRHLFLTRSCSLANFCHEGQRPDLAHLALSLILCVTGCGILVLPGAQAFGQAEAPSPTVRLQPGQTIRIRLQTGQRLEGHVAAVDSSPPVLRFAELQPPVAIAVIDSLWLREGAAGRSALVGGIVAGVGMFAVAASVCSGLTESAGCEDWGAVTGWSVAAAAGGALLGAAIGSRAPRWRLINPERITFSINPGPTGPCGRCARAILAECDLLPAFAGQPLWNPRAIIHRTR